MNQINHRCLSLAILCLCALALALGPLSGTALAQQKGPAPAPATGPEVSAQQKKIDAAVKKATDILLKRRPGRGSKLIELSILTLIHAGVDPATPTLKSMIDIMVKEPLATTYNVALKAVALELIDRNLYQKEIAECAQALVNYQALNGQWFYDAAFKESKDQKQNPVLTGTPKIIEVITGEQGPDGVTKRVTLPTKGYEVKRNNPKRPAVGDNSNTHYALFGLRSCARAGITIPKETWQDASNWLTKNIIEPDGGWSYACMDGMSTKPKPYGSMTVAGVVGLSIAKCYLNEDYKNDPTIQKGLKWLGDNFTAKFNPGAGFWDLPKDCWHYYYLYGLERVAAILDIDKIGGNDWYQEGVDYLLKNQARDGIWNAPTDDRYGEDALVDTCFAVLFLRKGTPVLKLTKVVTTGEENQNPAEKDKDKK